MFLIPMFTYSPPMYTFYPLSCSLHIHLDLVFWLQFKFQFCIFFGTLYILLTRPRALASDGLYVNVNKTMVKNIQLP